MLCRHPSSACVHASVGTRGWMLIVLGWRDVVGDALLDGAKAMSPVPEPGRSASD